mgnify:FL=1
MRRLALFCGGGLVCTGDASSVDAETRVGGSSRFLGERFVLLMRAARGGVGGFLLLVKKSVMERCCDIVSAREGAGHYNESLASFSHPRSVARTPDELSRGTATRIAQLGRERAAKRGW